MSNNENFIRWQATTISHLSYSINLILSFSVASFGFGISLLLNENFLPLGWQKILFTFSLIVLLVATALGLIGTINRLRDFRTTTRIIKLDQDSKNSNELSNLRNLTNGLGKKTWSIFWCQIGTFSLGVFLMSISLFSIFGEKLI